MTTLDEAPPDGWRWRALDALRALPVRARADPARILASLASVGLEMRVAPNQSCPTATGLGPPVDCAECGRPGLWVVLPDGRARVDHPPSWCPVGTDGPRRAVGW